ncbi:MAG: hypothetical protein ACO1RT_04335, partial [Planctomycetaceae bacterium]
MGLIGLPRVLAAVPLVGALLTGCDAPPPRTELDSEDFSVVMPSEVARPDRHEVSLVAQPPRPTREVVPTREG